MNLPINNLKKIARKYNLSLLVMFGSQVKGNSHEKSDFDFAFLPINSKFDYEELFNDLMGLLHSSNIDLINLQTTHNITLRFEILHNCLTIYEASPGLKMTLEWRSYINYVDFKKYFLQRDLVLDQRIEKMVA